jgi:hypothetical protein
VLAVAAGRCSGAERPTVLAVLVGTEGRITGLAFPASWASRFSLTGQAAVAPLPSDWYTSDGRDCCDQ